MDGSKTGETSKWGTKEVKRGETRRGGERRKTTGREEGMGTHGGKEIAKEGDRGWKKGGGK